MLVRRGHFVCLAGNGEEVLAQLDHDRFDLVLMDVQMPQMDGFEATRQIRRRESDWGQRVPVVAMTAHAMADDRQRCLDAGMDEYVAKPIRGRVLMATIAAALRRVGAAAGRGDKPAGPQAAPIPEASATRHDGPHAPLPPVQGIDWQRTLDELDGNVQVLRILVEATLEEAPRLTAAIHAAIDAQNAEQLRLSAHTLKGSLRYFGETPAFAAADSLERMGQKGDFHTVAVTARRLEEALAPALDSMRQYLLEQVADGSAGNHAPLGSLIKK